MRILKRCVDAVKGASLADLRGGRRDYVLIQPEQNLLAMGILKRCVDAVNGASLADLRGG